MMQIKLNAVRITQNENGTVSTKLTPVLVGGVEGAYASGELFITVPSQENQPEVLVYGAELNSDLGAFVEVVDEEPPI